MAERPDHELGFVLGAADRVVGAIELLEYVPDSNQLRFHLLRWLEMVEAQIQMDPALN